MTARVQTAVSRKRGFSKHCQCVLKNFNKRTKGYSYDVNDLACIHNGVSIFPGMMQSNLPCVNTKQLFQFYPICSQAFPSLGSGGKRLQNLTPRPLKRQKVVFIQPKKSWTHDFSLLFEAHQTSTPKLKLLSTLKEAGLGKKRIVF